MIARQLIRRFTTSAVRRSDEYGDGIPGHNLPFPVGNKYVTTLIFCIFFGSGFSIPYISLRSMMLKFQTHLVKLCVFANLIHIIKDDCTD